MKTARHIYAAALALLAACPAANNASAQALSNVLLPPQTVVGNVQGTTSGASAITFAALKVLLEVPTGANCAASNWLRSLSIGGVWTCSQPAITDISGLGAGISGWLAAPSSANLATAVTDETGTGALVFATNPALITPNLGTPSAATLTNATGLPISSGVSGLGASVATALGINIGSAGAPILFNGDGGTPTSMVGTNITGTAAGLTAGAASTVAIGGVSGMSAGCATALTTPTSVNLRACFTDETGTGLIYFQSGDIGTPSAGVITNLTGTCTSCVSNTFSVGNAANLNSGTLQAARTNGHMNGTATNDNAAAGEVGELMSNSAGAVALTTATPANAGQITLTAGDWDVYCGGIFSGAGGTVTSDVRLGLNTVSATLPASTPLQFFIYRSAGITDFMYAPTVGPHRVSITGASVTWYCVGQATFTTSTYNITASIRARRAR